MNVAEFWRVYDAFEVRRRLMGFERYNAGLGVKQVVFSYYRRSVFNLLGRTGEAL